MVILEAVACGAVELYCILQTSITMFISVSVDQMLNIFHSSAIQYHQKQQSSNDWTVGSLKELQPKLLTAFIEGGFMAAPSLWTTLALARCFINHKCTLTYITDNSDLSSSKILLNTQDLEVKYH